MKTEQSCPLCSDIVREPFWGSFLSCSSCGGIFRSRDSLPDAAEERQRYLHHQNTLQNRGYMAFLSPLISALTQRQTAEDRGLDFGSGPNPVLAQILEREGYKIGHYDPFFHADETLLSQRYDYIVCCEVIEHFHHPAREFSRLSSMLEPGARLYCMTELFQPQMDFISWPYKNDFTHCFFYRQETLEWIRNHFHFGSLSIHERLIVFEKQKE